MGFRATVLHVDDSPADATITRLALEGVEGIHELVQFSSGRKALDYLLQVEPFEDARTPDLVLLDLKLRDIDGLEFLQRMRHDPELQTVPVVVLSGSEDPAMAVESYRLGARAFVPKPTNVAGYRRLARAIADFWFGVARLPVPDESE